MTLPLIKKERTVHSFPNQMKENTLCECNVIKKNIKRKNAPIYILRSQIQTLTTIMNNQYRDNIQPCY